MSIVKEFRETEKMLKQLEERALEIKSSQDYRLEKELGEMVRALMVEYKKSLREIIALVEPELMKKIIKLEAGGNQTKRKNKPRNVRRYTNPHTGDVVETKGGNHKVLREWREKWGREAIDSWGVAIN